MTVDLLATVPPEVLKCVRSKRHDLDPVRIEVHARRGSKPIQLRDILRCDRCQTERHDILDCSDWDRWQVLRHEYHWPEDYPRGVTTIDPAVLLRETVLARATPELRRAFGLAA